MERVEGVERVERVESRAEQVEWSGVEWGWEALHFRTRKPPF